MKFVGQVRSLVEKSLRGQKEKERITRRGGDEIETCRIDRPRCQVFLKVIFECSFDESAEGDRAGPRSRVFLGGARHAAHHRNVSTRPEIKCLSNDTVDRSRHHSLSLLASESRSVYGTRTGDNA